MKYSKSPLVILAREIAETYPDVAPSLNNGEQFQLKLTAMRGTFLIFFCFSVFFKIFGRAGPRHASNEMSGSSRSARRQIFSFVRPLALKKMQKNENRTNRGKKRTNVRGKVEL